MKPLWPWLPNRKFQKTSNIPKKYLTLTLGEITFILGEITFTFGDSRRFGFFFFGGGGFAGGRFGTLWVGEPRRGYRNIWPLCAPNSSRQLPEQQSEVNSHELVSASVGHFRFPLPLAFFTGVSFRKGFSWKSLHKTLISTIFCVLLSQFEFANVLLPHPVSATKLTFETTLKMSNFSTSFFEKIPRHRKQKPVVISGFPLCNPLAT